MLTINEVHYGFLNLYAPNQVAEQTLFWARLLYELPDMENWLVGGDFNMVEMIRDRCGGGHITVHGHELACFERLCFYLKISDAWISQSYMQDS